LQGAIIVVIIGCVEPAAPTGAASPVELDEIGERLLAAAAEVLAERGYDKAGVAEIARRAGVTTGAIYSRYPGKAELLVEAIDPHATDELEHLFADHQFKGRMEDILLQAGTGLVKGLDEHAPLLLEAWVAGRRHPDVAEVINRRVSERQARLRDIVEAAKADGGITSELDTESVVTFCQAVGFGFLLIEALDLALPAPGPWEQLIGRLVASLRDEPGKASPTSATSDQHTTQGESE
jgi:AcrR family transcriptional regulator